MEDETTLHHIPYLEDCITEKETKFLEELISNYEGNIHTIKRDEFTDNVFARLADTLFGWYHYQLMNTD